MCVCVLCGFFSIYFPIVCHSILNGHSLDYNKIYHLHNENGKRNCSISIAMLPYRKNHQLQQQQIHSLVMTLIEANIDNSEARQYIEQSHQCMKVKQPVSGELEKEFLKLIFHFPP